MERRVFLLMSAAAIGASAAGCTASANTPRIAPERQITVAASRTAVKEQVALMLVGRGYQLTKDTDFLMEFSRVSDDFMTNFLLSSEYDSRVQVRIALTFIGDNPVNLSWRGYAVTNPGSAFERLTEITHNPDGDKVQAEINAIKARLEG